VSPEAAASLRVGAAELEHAHRLLDAADRHGVAREEADAAGMGGDAERLGGEVAVGDVLAEQVMKFMVAEDRW
jgi:hypothetical protein